jgi:hypothetical protein
MWAARGVTVFDAHFGVAFSRQHANAAQWEIPKPAGYSNADVMDSIYITIRLGGGQRGDTIALFGKGG